MNKSIYSDDFIWYDPTIKASIEALGKKYPNAIPVFGGALSAAKYVNCDNPNMGKFISMIADAIRSAEFYGWHEDAIGVIKRFCNLCYVDPALVECYLGVRLEV